MYKIQKIVVMQVAFVGMEEEPQFYTLRTLLGPMIWEFMRKKHSDILCDKNHMLPGSGACRDGVDPILQNEAIFTSVWFLDEKQTNKKHYFWVIFSHKFVNF